MLSNKLLIPRGNGYKKNAFTIIELVTVIVLIAILAGALIPRIVGIEARARDVTREQQLNSIVSALEVYATDHAGRYPEGPYPLAWHSFGSGLYAGVLYADTKRPPTYSQYWSVDDIMSPLQKYMASMPKDPGHGVKINVADGSCKKGGNYFAYYTNNHLPMVVVTAVKESKRGNTTNCVGYLDTNKGAFQAVGVGLCDPRTSTGTCPVFLREMLSIEPNSPSNPDQGTTNPQNPGNPESRGNGNTGLGGYTGDIGPQQCFVLQGNTIVDYKKEILPGMVCPLSIVIPSQIGDVEITNIRTNAFKAKGITKVVLPGNLETIGSSAFVHNGLNKNSDNLSWIPTSSEQVREVQGDIRVWLNRPPTSEDCFTFFKGTISNYDKTCGIDVSLPSSIRGEPVTSIATNAFKSKSLHSIVINNGMTIIGDSAFNNNNLISAVIPDTINYIGVSAFANNNLTAIKIPASVSYYGTDALRSNGINKTSSNLNWIYDGKPQSRHTEGDLRVLDGQHIYKCLLYEVATQSIVGYDTACGTDVEIPSSINGKPVITIGRNAFYGLGITSVTIPKSVTTIGDYAFYNNKLTALDLPNSVTTIGAYAFNTNKIISLDMPDSVTTLGPQAFSSNSLQYLKLSNNLTSIDGAFMHNQLTEITIPSSFKSLVNHVFAYNNLTTVRLPSTLISVSNFAFHHNGLDKTSGNLIWDNNGSDQDWRLEGNTWIRDGQIIHNCLLFEDGIIKGYDIDCGKDVVIPSSISGQAVTEIAKGAFYTLGINSIVLPEGLVKIGSNAFNTNNIASITFPSSLRTIEDSAFSANKITSITLPSTLTNVGRIAFGNVLARFPDGTDQYWYKQGGLWVRDGQVISDCFTFSNHTIRAHDTSCGSKDIVIPETINGETVTTIGKLVFYGHNITSVQFPNTITTIEEGAFNLNKITSLHLPDSIKTISSTAFYRNRLVSISFPSSLTLLGSNAFLSNGSLGDSNDIPKGGNNRGPGEASSRHIEGTTWVKDTQGTGDQGYGPLSIVLEVTVGSAQQTLKLNKYFNVSNYVVNRGDGQSSTVTSSATHSYNTPGVYKVELRWPGTRWLFGSSGLPLVPQAGTTVDSVKISYMPSLADGFGSSAATPGTYYFAYFNKDGAIRSLPAGSFDTSNITRADGRFFYQFNNNGLLTSLPEGSFDISRVSGYVDLFFSSFNQGGALTSLPVGSFKIGGITTTANGVFSSFNQDGALTSLPSGSFDTSNITSVGNSFFSSFNYNGALSSLPAGSFNISNIISAGNGLFSSFNYNGALTSLPVGSFDTSHLTTVGTSFFTSFNANGKLNRVSPGTGVAIKNMTSGTVPFHYRDGSSKSLSIPSGGYFEDYKTS